MSEFIMTRGAQLKKNAQENFVSIVYSSTKKKKEPNENVKDKGKNFLFNELSKTDEKSEQEKEMKKLRWDVMKFASSSLEGASKHKAKVALAISLGAKPPKNRRKNYKLLKEQRSKEKIDTPNQPEHQSGYSESLKKHKVKKNKSKKEPGLLGVYGKVQKKTVR